MTRFACHGCTHVCFPPFHSCVCTRAPQSLTVKNVSLGVVGPDEKFHVLTEAELGPYVRVCGLLPLICVCSPPGSSAHTPPPPFAAVWCDPPCSWWCWCIGSYSRCNRVKGRGHGTGRVTNTISPAHTHTHTLAPLPVTHNDSVIHGFATLYKSCPAGHPTAEGDGDEGRP